MGRPENTARPDRRRGLTSRRRFQKNSCGLAARLEFRAAAEAELLNSIVTLLHQRERVVEAQRTEWRVPDQTDADRGADRAGIRRRLERFTRHVPRRRAFVVPE